MLQKSWWGVLNALCMAVLLSAPAAYGGEPALFAALALNRFPSPIELPDLSLPDPNGKNIPLRSFQGRVVLLNFWTTW